MKQRNQTIDERKKLTIAVVAIAVIAIIAIVTSTITGNWIERERRSFAFSATGLSDGSGNTIEIHGAGAVGMSGWIMFQPGGMNLTTWARGSGTLTITTAGGKYKTNWKAVEKGDYGYTEDWVLTKIRLADPPSGLPSELNVELIEGSEPNSGTIILSSGAITYIGLELTHTGTIYSGAGTVVVH